jgi:uncharacterized membrane protein YgcG
MKTTTLRCLRLLIISLLLMVVPALAQTQAKEPASSPPPVSQPLVSEGELAIQLASGLGVLSTSDAVEAESALGDSGIAPNNGWIADYPVTPDIIAELRQSVASAAESKQLSLARDEALKRFDTTIAGFGVTVRPYTSGESAANRPVSCENYPEPAMISNTYSGEGPPIVTYYCPPPDYYYLYAWVPYPFWWSDFWFPGFFILHDFHRHAFIHNRFVLVSNHFNDNRRHRIFRIDPVERFHGRTFAGIGVRNSRNFTPTGVTNGARTIFNAPRGEASRSGTGSTGWSGRGGGSGMRGSGSGSGGTRGSGSGSGGIRGGGR